MKALPGRAWLAALVVAVAAAGPVAEGGGQPAPGAPHVVVRGPTELRRLGETLIDDPATWRPFPGIGTLPEVGVDSIEIWFTPDLVGDVPETLRYPEPWVAGVANPAAGQIAIRTGPALGGPGGLRAVLRHELAHLALEAATGGNHSRWLTEGYAQYASGEWSLDDAWHLQYAFLRRGAATLQDIDLRFRRHTADVRMGYLLSYTAVYELAALGGEAGLRSVFRHLRDGSAFDEAITRTFGITEDAFERRWKRSLVDRYGWLYLFSRAGVFWLGVTVLVLFVSLRRARRDRDRLVALRAAELRAEEGAEPAPSSGSSEEGPSPGSA